MERAPWLCCLGPVGLSLSSPRGPPSSAGVAQGRPRAAGLRAGGDSARLCQRFPLCLGS